MSKTTILVLQGERSQFDELLPEISKLDESISVVNSVEEAMVHISQYKPKLLLADLMVGGVETTGFVDSIDKIGLRLDMRVVIFSSQEENYVEIAALNAGADDFMVKPVNKYVFSSRLNAWMRHQRMKQQIQAQNEASTKVVLDQEKYLAFVDSEPVDLQRKEFEIISLLLSKPRKVFSRGEIIKSIWADKDNVNERTVDVHIRNLRSKLGTRRIRTYKGVGYCYDSL